MASRNFMTHLILICILTVCTLSFSSLGQNRIKEYVKSNAVPVFTVEDSTDNSDLEQIGIAIGESRIVMLGEQDHGDKPGYLAKTRLIKYLHQTKGFNVVAYENDFFNTNYNWALVKAGKLSVDSIVNKSISITWASCGTSSPFFVDYLPTTLKSKHPLEISGFDNETATSQTLPLLDSILRSLNLPITQSSQYLSDIMPLLAVWYKYTSDTVVTDKIIGY